MSDISKLVQLKSDNTILCFSCRYRHVHRLSEDEILVICKKYTYTLPSIRLRCICYEYKSPNIRYKYTDITAEYL